MEILFSIVGKIAEFTVEPIGHQLSYLCFIRNNIQKLKSNVEMLKETRESVERMVYNARRNAEDIKPGVQNWLTKVDAIIEKSELILNNEDQQVRFCLNLVQRHQLSRKAVKMANEVLEIKNEGNFDRVSYNVALSKYESSLTKISDFLHFESRKSTIEKIMDALVDYNVNKIGIYGMGGVGKTMIVKEISREVIEKKLFDEVVISTISQTPDLKRIQEELAEKLGLKLEEDTLEGRALKLHKRLKMEKTSLVVLDDIWAHIDLETIGIPNGVDQKGCKILFSSRDKHTLSNDMCIDKIFEIKVLQKDEAWNLFKTIAGETIEGSDLKSIVIEIVRECADLPIAIITVAKALRNKHTSVWKDALNQLRHPVAVNIRGMNEKVYASLKLSYDQLESEEAKKLFLLCSMFPEDFEINVQHLHIYAMALGLLHGVDTVAQGRYRITKLVDDLISSSLLLEYMNHYVKMHDLVRDVAILIASRDDQIRTLSYVKNLNEWEVDKISSNHTAVYLNVGRCQSPPQKLMLPKIQLLISVGRWPFVQELPISFFEGMKELKVLELHSMKISLLPPSLHCFTNVRSLHLFKSELGNIDMIGELNKLEILSFKGSNITQIPMAISQLTQLKVLDLSNCGKLKVIPSNVLCKLTKLEELNLETYEGWEGEELLNKEDRKNAALSELNNLSCLSAVCLCIQDEKVMPKQMFSMELNLETFNISIGFPTKTMYFDEDIRKGLSLKMESECCMNEGIKMLLKWSEKLHLEGSISAKVFLFQLDENESSHVKYLKLRNISGLQHIIHEQKQPFRKALSNLVHLYMKDLKDLESIIHGYDRRSPFKKLKSVAVKQCKKLRSVFFNSIVDDVSNLETIKIEDCEMIEVIIVMVCEEAIKKFEFTHLKSLLLCGLPQLTSFSSKIEKFKQLNLESSEKCRTSKPSNNNSFFSEKVSFPNLKRLRIERANNLTMICDSVLFPNSFSKLAEVYLDSCHNLKKVFSSKIMSILMSLKFISIKNCNLLEGIFEAQESNVTKESAALLPQLRNLELSNLPNLRYVWNEDACELLVFENIELLSIHQCPKLKLRKKCVIKVLPQLKHLEIDLSEMKEILEKEKSVQTLELDQFKTSEVKSIQLRDSSELFSKLTTLKLHGSVDYNLTDLPMEIVQILPHLKRFELNEAFIEEVFPNERLINNNMKEQQCARSELLQRLCLTKLPKLRHLWKEGSQKKTSLQHLNDLWISECGKLNNLVPSSSVSFRSLSELYIYKCHGLTHLLSPSVARTLVQLQVLELYQCKRMTTVIVGGDKDQGNDEIVFNKLKMLTLSNFSQLTSFHSGRCIIKFPSLSLVDIESCPEMKVFSLGIVSTPHLAHEMIKFSYNDNYFRSKDPKQIIVEDINIIIRQIWEDNFDTSIPYLFAEQNLEENQSDHSSSHVEE